MVKAGLRRVVGLSIFLLLAGVAAAADVTGTWAGTISDRGRNTYTFRLILKQSGAKVTGIVNGAPPHGEDEPIVAGNVEGGTITLTIQIPGPNGHPEALVYRGHLNGNLIEGSASRPRGGHLPFKVMKVAASAAGPGQLEAGGTFGPEKGWLVVSGGEEPVLPAVTQRFVSLAGGPKAHIVLIPTAMQKPPEQEIEAYKKWLNAKDITVLDTHDPAVANSDAFVAPLRTATGVWFTGGDESNIVNAYVGTLVQKELKGVLARGGVVGGSSAGAIVLGAIGLIPPKRSPSGFVPMDNRTFGLVRNVFIIPHVIQMDWKNRMAEGMAAYQGLLGIGVDAGAAIVIHGNQCQVIGKSKVLVPNGSGKDGKGYEVCLAGARFDLAQAMRKAHVRPEESHNRAVRAAR